MAPELRGQGTGYALIDLLAERVLRDSGMASTGPVDVRLLADRLGLAVRFAAISGARGMLRIDSGRPTITVERRLSRTNTRFTLGHEIGHWILAAYPSEARAVWCEEPALRDAERFCDAFASALLLPVSWTQSFLAEEVRAGERAIDRLIRLAVRADVSPDAVAVRVTRVAGWRRLLLHIRWAGSRWRVLSSIGYKRGPWRAGIAITPEMAARLVALMAAEHRAEGHGEPVQDWLALQVGDWSCRVPGELRRHGTSAFACIEPNRARTARSCVEDGPSGSRRPSSP